MNHGVDLLHWSNLIFLLPMGVAMLLLALSALGVGGGDDSDGDAGNGGDSDGSDGSEAGDAEGNAGGGDGAAEGDDNSSATGRGLAGLLGIGTAPTSMVLSAFALIWGLAGFWANRFLLKTPSPGLGAVLPSLGIALVCSVLGARGTATLAARLMPQKETTAASRQSLVLLKGRATFPVSEKAGRVRVYDEHKTLHDNPARVAIGRPPIPKGRAIRVVDVDAAGRLIVEEE